MEVVTRRNALEHKANILNPSTNINTNYTMMRTVNHSSLKEGA